MNRSDIIIVRTPLWIKPVGFNTLIFSIVLSLFFMIGGAYENVKFVGIPLLLISIITIYLTLHWKIIVNTNGIIVVHNFKIRKKIAFASIDKVVCRKEIMTNLEEGEGMYIYANGKKITNFDQTFWEYDSFKKILISNNIEITIK